MWSKEKKDFVILSSAKISENVEAVVSEYGEEGYTLGQRMTVEENGKPFQMYLKGALHFESVNDMIALRDALNVAIAYEQK